jgi:16S rRNA (uracil1498-N3)-methyltransferase
VHLENLSGQKESDAPMTRFVMWEGERDSSLRHKLRTINEKGKVNRVDILIGPEGGFSEVEIQQVLKVGFQPASLGRRILRMETAAIVTTSLVLYEMGEMEMAES